MRLSALQQVDDGSFSFSILDGEIDSKDRLEGLIDLCHSTRTSSFFLVHVIVFCISFQAPGYARKQKRGRGDRADAFAHAHRRVGTAAERQLLSCEPGEQTPATDPPPPPTCVWRMKSERGAERVCYLLQVCGRFFLSDSLSFVRPELVRR